MKWLDNPDSVSREELGNNRKEAEAADYRALSADFAARAAAIKAELNEPEKAAYWVDDYFKESGEDNQTYLDKLKQQ